MFVTARLGHCEQIELRLFGQVARAGTEQPHRRTRLRGYPFVEQLRRRRGEWSCFLRRRANGTLTRVCFEILATDLHGQSFGEPTLSAQSRGCAVRELREFGVQLFGIE